MIYFISDLHLQASNSKNTELFLSFLRNKASHADALYILGDLFAVWFGDDLCSEYEHMIIDEIRALSKYNIPVYFINGNRDFLIGKKFCQLANCQLLADPTVITAFGRKFLLTHGDLLCTKDKKYQKYRSFVQNPIIKKIFLSLPKGLRLKIGNWVKNTASSTNRNFKPTNTEQYDVVENFVQAWVNDYKVSCLIHGHTHNAAIHNFENYTRIVLGDWTDKSAKILCLTESEFQLEDLTK